MLCKITDISASTKKLNKPEIEEHHDKIDCYIIWVDLGFCEYLEAAKENYNDYNSGCVA